jgi:hypothetical protein
VPASSPRMAKPIKKLIWRIQGIDAGVSKEEVPKYFDESERDRISVETLCPSVDDPCHHLTATIKYTHDADALEHVPCLHDDFRDELYIDRDFNGFTPLYSPDPGTHEAEYVAIRISDRPGQNANYDSQYHRCHWSRRSCNRVVVFEIQ